MRKIFLIIIMGMFLMSLASAAIWDDTKYYFKFDETSGSTAVDETDTTNGTITAGVDLNQTGIIGTAFNFDGNSVEIGGIAADNDWSVSLWVKPASFSQEGTLWIDDENARLNINTSGYLKCGVDDGASSDYVFSTNSLSTGSWYHVVCVRDKSANIKLYVNGTLNATKSSTRDAFNNGFTPAIGERGGTNQFYGVIDEVGIWERILDEDEVSSLYSKLEYGRASIGDFDVNLTTPDGTDFYETASTTIQLNFSVINQTGAIIENISLWTNQSGNYTLNDTINLSGQSLQEYNGTFNFSTNGISNDIGWKVQVIPLSGAQSNSSVYTLDYNEIYFGICNATYSDVYLNISFKDESDLETIQATIPDAEFIYYVGDGSVTKTYDYINNTPNYEYNFCASPSTIPFYVTPYVQYKNGTDYPQRIWNPTVQTYNNTTTDQVLYLVNTLDGQQVTFQVLTQNDQPISGVAVTVEREISGSVITIGTGTTSSAGLVTFELNPDFSHTFNFSKSGFTTYSTSFNPTQTEYTVVLGSTTTEQLNSTLKGLSYSLLPTDSYLENDTSYTFGLNVTSDYWDYDEYGFTLRLANGTIVATESTSAEGTQLTTNYNTGNQSIIYIYWYVKLDGEYTNFTKYWIVQNTEYESYSLKIFFEDLESYIDSGLFGLDDFGKNLIVFFVLLITLGVFSYKYGIANPIGLTGLAFLIVYFFDSVTGLLPQYTIGNTTISPTFIMAIIIAVVILNEVRRQ